MLHPLQLFKTLSDETRLSIIMLLRDHRVAAESLPPYGAAPRVRAGYRSPGREMDPLPFISPHACMGGNHYRQQLELPSGRDA